MTATYVYVISGADDTLYVGHTKNLVARLHNHANEPWGNRITKIRARVFAKKDEALWWERTYIADLEPEFNIQGNPRYMSWERFLGWAGIEVPA